MRVYFFSPKISTPELDVNYKKIIEALRSAGVFAVASSDENNVDFKKEELEQMTEAGEILLDKMDAIVVEASQPDQEIGYLLAYAISQKKPLLYLFRRGTAERVSGGYLTKKNTPEFIKMRLYTPQSLIQVVLEFIEEVSNGTAMAEKPNIKFTLRITPQIERYLAQKAKQHKTTKADYVREKMIKRLMEEEKKN